MSDLILQQDFAAPAERVYDALADQDAMGSWMGSKISVPTRGPSGLVGTVRRIHLLGPLVFDERILEAERPGHLAYQICSRVPLLVRHRGELTVEARGAQQSRVTWRVALELQPAFMGSLVRAILGLVLGLALKRLARRLG